jgi:hypothetical protein
MRIDAAELPSPPDRGSLRPVTAALHRPLSFTHLLTLPHCTRRHIEPTSAVAAAGLSRLLTAGVIRPQEDTVLVLTGSGLKAGATTGELLKLHARPE